METTMTCPYCGGKMKSCATMPYDGTDGMRTAEWVRCTHCRHATVARITRNVGKRAAA